MVLFSMGDGEITSRLSAIEIIIAPFQIEDENPQI